MTTPHIFQFVTALAFTLLALIFLMRRGDASGANRYKLAGILFLIAAALNWLLFAGVL